MKKVLITGGSGFIGHALVNELANGGYEVIVLSRNPEHIHGLSNGAHAERWNGRNGDGWASLVNGAMAIVNLAGESIGIPPLPWTAERKRRIRESRVNAGRAVTEAIRTATVRPPVLIQSSAVGYYGLRGDKVLAENESAGADFLAQVTVDWEKSTAEVEALGVRRAIIRTGLPLSTKGGVFPLLALPFRFFVGGPIGSGKQYLPWIHTADLVRAIRFLIENESTRGAFNLSAPNPVTNADFGRTLGRVMHRPSMIPVPGFALKLALGEMAELLLLNGQRAIPQRLLEAGFEFHFPNAEGALREIIQSEN